MAIERRYQGREQSRDRNEALYQEQWYGTEAEVDAYIATLSIGHWESGKGYLHRWQKRQDNPHIWYVEVTYRVTYETAGNEEVDDDSSSSSSAKTYTLSVRNISIPIESKSGYKACWTHYLLGIGGATLPAWWSTATDTLLAPALRQYYEWVSSISEIPLEPDSRGLYWYILATPTKPGVQTYDQALFVVTEKSKHKTSTQAGNAISTHINTINTPPHTFGITGGNWKLDEGSVEHDGQKWIATRSWTHADAWDTDLYGSN